MATRVISYTPGEFQRELRTRVNARLAEQGRTYRGGWRASAAAAPAVAWFYASYAALVFVPMPLPLVVVVTASLGLAASASLTGVVHNALHRSLFSKRWMDSAVTYLAGPVGLSARWWTANHCHGHHAYTNVDGLDGDLGPNSALRLTATQPWRPHHRYQHLYVWAMLPLLWITMVLVSDHEFMVHGTIKGRQVARPSLMRTVGLHFEKLAPVALLIGVALLLHPPLEVIAIALGTALVIGTSYSLMIIANHCVDTSDFPTIDHASGKVAEEWAVTQVVGSTTIAIRNPLLRWFFAGVDLHIEHHLFPRMAHVHLRTIAPVVRETCSEFGIRYNEIPSLRAAYASYGRYLRGLGDPTPLARAVVTPAA